MELKLSLEEAQNLASAYMQKGYHCGPAVLQVMWEAYGLEDENYLWAAIPFMGGISGANKATCGALSGAAVSLAFRHKTSLKDKHKAKAARNRARLLSGNLAKEFDRKFGHVTCQELLGIDFSQEGAYQEFRRSGLADKKCYRYVTHIIDRLFEMEKEGAD